MSKSQPIRSTSPLEKSGLPGLSDESQFVEWISKNGKTLVYIIVGLLALFFVIYRFSASKQQKTESDYFNAANYFSLLQRSGTNEEETLNKLNDIIQRHPELHAQYDGPIAQQLLNENKVADAMNYADGSLKRITKDNLPLYKDFASTSLLISEKKYKDALERSKILQQNSLANASEYKNNYLEALNLLRIAILYQELGQKQEELNAWNELTNYLTTTSTQLIKPLTFGKVSLADYIEHRKNILKQ